MSTEPAKVVVEDTSRASKGLVFHVARWWSWAYLIDWIFLVLLVVAAAVVFDEFPGFVPPFKRYMPTTDASIAYPYDKSPIFPTYGLVIVCIALPIVCFAISQFYARSLHDLHHALLGWAESCSITYIITAVLKTVVGRYRPDYLNRLATADESKWRDGQLSFPSGHSSMSFAAFTFLALYMAGKTGIFRKDSHRSLFLPILAMSPLVLATIISISRLMDYNHNFIDVAAGATLGFGIANFAYSLNFYPLYSTKSELPRLHAPEKDESEDDADGTYSKNYSYAGLTTTDLDQKLA